MSLCIRPGTGTRQHDGAHLMPLLVRAAASITDRRGELSREDSELVRELLRTALRMLDGTAPPWTGLHPP